MGLREVQPAVAKRKKLLARLAGSVEVSAIEAVLAAAGSVKGSAGGQQETDGREARPDRTRPSTVCFATWSLILRQHADWLRFYPIVPRGSNSVQPTGLAGRIRCAEESRPDNCDSPAELKLIPLLGLAARPPQRSESASQGWVNEECHSVKSSGRPYHRISRRRRWPPISSWGSAPQLGMLPGICLGSLQRITEHERKTAVD